MKKPKMTGKQFRKRREELGFKERQKVADHIGVSINTVKAWEYGFRRVPVYAINSLRRLAVQRGMA